MGLLAIVSIAESAILPLPADMASAAPGTARASTPRPRSRAVGLNSNAAGLLPPAPDTTRVKGLTYATVRGVPSLGRPVSASWRAKDLGLSMVLFGIVAFLWIYFRG